MKNLVLEKSLLILLCVSLFISCSKIKSETFTAEGSETVTEMASVENSEDGFEQQNENSEKEESSEFESVSPRMILVEGGTFKLGTEIEGFHDVTVSSFEIGETEVTIGQYQSVTDEKEIDESLRNYPVTDVNWFEAVIYCNKLSMKCGYEPCYSINGETNPLMWGTDIPSLSEDKGQVGDMTVWNTVQCNFTANGYRLPTEAEWAFAAQGGNKSNHTKYSGSNNINEVGWTQKNSEGHLCEVAMKKPNELDIYDMSGNVWEWCWDRNGVYATVPEFNPTGPNKGSWHRVRRGGGWGTPDSDSEITYSSSDSPDVQSPYIGFRLCRSIGDRTEVQAEESSKNAFTNCYFNSDKDQIVLSNETGNYKLSVWLYGTPIEYGEYQVFGSDKETLLEGVLEEDSDSRDVKTTLFIRYSEDSINVSGSAQLYKPHSATKSGEILDFNYEGSLVKLME